jgi:3-deoxy-7-phosphoheptulonate synthase
MQPKKIENLNILASSPLSPPSAVKNLLPVTPQAIETVSKARQEIKDIIQMRDKRLLIIVGPCAIYDVDAALDYAKRLVAIKQKLANELLIVMRVYFEKPRTILGWKGLINDPYIDDSFEIEEGLRRARKILNDINSLGLAAATEALDPIVPQYIGDLVAWNAIGARTTESQTHREMSSGLSTPVGFKNGTDGNITVAAQAIKAAASSHRFLGVNEQGVISVFHTRGNPDCHLVLRGGNKPNYDAESITIAEQVLGKYELQAKIIVDCSHGNSNKNHLMQAEVFRNCLEQRINGTRSIIGLMLESNIYAGRQDAINLKEKPLNYGVSITDACIDWETTEELLKEAAAKL